jgi:hypothetical protein
MDSFLEKGKENKSEEKEMNVSIWLDMYKYLNQKKYEINNNEVLISNNYIINKKINDLIKILEEKLKDNCEHELEEDYIEIDFERYQKICYCTKCMLTF